MIRSVRLKNFKGHLDTEVQLGRLTMLVGNNASGKTSVLEALCWQAAVGRDPAATLGQPPYPADLIRRGAQSPLAIEVSGVDDEARWTTRLTLTAEKTPTGDDHWLAKAFLNTEEVAHASATSNTASHGGAWQKIGSPLGKVNIFRFQAGKIAAAAYSDARIASIEEDGTNVAVVLAAMKLGDDDIFQQIEDSMRALVPSLEKIRIRPATVRRPLGDEVIGHRIHFDFTGAANVPATGASQGTLVALALLTVLHGPNHPNLVLIDDFDHALHPQAQMELVRMLKALLSLPAFVDLQIIATTHSPYALDELTPDDVQVFTLRRDGTVASKRLSEHPEAARTKGALSAGELWSLDPERKWVLGE